MALQMTWQPSLQRRKTGAPPLGLRNLGNTCYLNSVLQCLTYTPPLANFCLRAQHSRLCKKLDGERGDEDKKRECPFCTLEKRIARSLSIDGPHDAPSKVESFLRLFAEHLQWGRQEDAHEFLRYVIDACHNTCVKILKATDGGGIGSDRERGGGSVPNTVVREMFGGALLSQVKCLSCNTESNKTDEIMDVSLDLYQSNSLRDALRRFFQAEILDGSNKYSCSSCKRLSEARKQMFILQAPNVLVIQLKRFEGMYGGKINKDVAFEEVLVLSSFMCKASQDPQPEYNLFGSIVHSGYSPESGHYYAYIKDATGRWYCCNDAYVSLSTPQEVLSEKVYILFYVRSNQKPKPTKPGLARNGLKSVYFNGNDAPLSRKPSVNSRQQIVKPNVTLDHENRTPAISNANGSAASLSQKSSTPSKSAAVKLNGCLHPEQDTTVLKNNKILFRPMINFPQKNVELKRGACKNGNGNLKDHGTAVTEKNGSSEQSKIEKKYCTLPISKSNKNSTLAHGKESPVCNANASNGNCSLESVERNTNCVGTLSNGNGCSKSTQVGAHDNEDTFKTSPFTNGTYVSHGQVIEKTILGVSGSKRKVENTLGAISASDSCREDVSSRHRTNEAYYSPGGLEKYKEMIATEASLKLRSCGWLDEVHNFMRAKKRLCAEVKGKGPDKNELKKLLIADARKTFTSKIPNSIRQNLIDRLKSFSQGNNLLDV